MSKFKPKLLGFLCNWCSYAGADLTGVSRIQYPPNLKIIRVMCSGRVDPVIVLEAFLQGVDGVLVLGCHPGDCHYIAGNYQAKGKMKTTAKILARAGLIEERLRLDWVSAAEGERFARIVREFTLRLGELGPLGEGEGLGHEALKERLAAAQEALRGEALRWLMGKELELVEEENVYGERISQGEFDLLVEANISREYARSRISLLIEKNPLSVKEIAREIDASPREVLKHMVAMRQRGSVSMVEAEGTSPKYIKA